MAGRPTLISRTKALLRRSAIVFYGYTLYGLLAGQSAMVVPMGQQDYRPQLGIDPKRQIEAYAAAVRRSLGPVPLFLCASHWPMKSILSIWPGGAQMPLPRCCRDRPLLMPPGGERCEASSHRCSSWAFTCLTPWRCYGLGLTGARPSTIASTLISPLPAMRLLPLRWQGIRRCHCLLRMYVATAHP